MSLQESNSVAPSIIPAPNSGHGVSGSELSIPEPARPDAGSNPGSGTADEDWFFNVAVAVFGRTETGMQLHLATGWPRTSCYAFVARERDQRRKPSPEFLRILFRSEHGAPFHDAFMSGSKARWWLDRQRDVRLAAASRCFIAEVAKED